MKGFGKALKRTPFMVSTKVGMAKRSTDDEFADLERQFAILEKAVEKFLKDSKSYTTSVIGLVSSGENFAKHWAVLFQPISSEADLASKHPNSAPVFRNLDAYVQVSEEIKATITPELELIESRVVAPVKELQNIMKVIRKTITKREHKLTDYDRHNNSLTKLRDKKEKTLNDEKNLFKLEQDFEFATNEYTQINDALKSDVPQFLLLVTRFIEPLFQSYYYMQLNIVWVIVEKLNAFAEGEFEISSMSATQITEDYEAKRTDAWQTVENLNIIKKIISVSRLVQAARANSATSSTHSGSVSPITPPSRSPTSTYVGKKPPPPPPGPPISPSSSARPPPPPYSAAPPPVKPVKPLMPPQPSMASKPPLSPKPSLGGAAAAAASIAASRNGMAGPSSFGAAGTKNNSVVTKRPPPPPPVKAKPPPPPRPKYVVALYDFSAQADGDLSFKAGDHIEIIERSANAEEWWTGKLGGVQGVFPGNYVQDP